MTTRPLTTSMQKALVAMLTGPLTRARHVTMGDGWLDHAKGYHGLSVIRALHQRGLTLPPTGLAVLSIAGRQVAQKIQAGNTTRHDAA